MKRIHTSERNGSTTEAVARVEYGEGQAEQTDARQEGDRFSGVC
jgi:hypothetical protein